MIDESLKIKLNQFMLAYERQCAEIEFQRQNIKQNVMLSIVETRNNKKNSQLNFSQLQKSIVKEKGPQNLASSKQTKFSDDKQMDYKNPDSEIKQNDFTSMQKSKFVPSNSKLLQRSNITIRNSKLNNNFMKNDPYEEFEQRKAQRAQKLEQPIQKSRKTGILNNSYLIPRDRNVEVTDLNVGENDSKLVSFNERKSTVSKSPKNRDNRSGLLNKSQVNQPEERSVNLAESSISRRSQRPSNNQSQMQKSQHQMQKQLEENYSMLAQSKAFQKNSRLYANSQKAIKPNQSLIVKQDEEEEEPQYPTFKRPSFQFVTNIEELRQSNPYQDEEEQQEEDYEPSPQKTGKWNSRPKNVYEQKEPEYEDVQQHEQNFDQEEHQVDQSQHFSHMPEDQSMMMASELNQNPPSRLEEERKSYFAFEINMEKSSLPSNQNIEELKKKKILELERKRLERMENNSRRKQNPSEISNSSKPEKKQHSNVFLRNNSKNPSRRESDNRDSLNKSVNEKKNDRSRNLKNSNIREDTTGQESAFHDNKTTMTKYGEQSKFNPRSTSPTPLNTIKTIQTDKRPPLQKNRRQDNIFAGEQTTYQQRQRSSQKLSADPKIVPIDRKNSFQKKSNLKLMINAITYTCLPGELNRRQREKLIDVLEDYENEFFIFLFKEYSRKVIKGIYILDGNQEKMIKIYGDKAPSQVFPEQVHEFYRFDSGSREFKKIDGCKSFSFSIHAIDMK